MQLYSTASYQNNDLHGIELGNNDLTGWNFAGKNLTDADFEETDLTDVDFRDADLTNVEFGDSILTNANFRGAIIINAWLGYATRSGFTAEQFYSTASYQADDLRRVSLQGNDLSGWDFKGKNLTGAKLYAATWTNAILSWANLTEVSFWQSDLRNADLDESNLTDADLGFCDLRGARLSPAQIASAASSEGAILPDGRIEGLTLGPWEHLEVRDHALPITVESVVSLDPSALLHMVFEDEYWDSTIAFQPDIDVSLGGTLKLLFADDVRPADLIGTTFDLFDWDGAIVTGQFDEIGGEPGVIWDTSRLYTTGQVTMVPEPSTFLLLLIAMMGYVFRHRKSAARKQLLEPLESST
jgi:uncharacterized protein YjbI with pentapeptide repeats